MHTLNFSSNYSNRGKQLKRHFRIIISE